MRYFEVQKDSRRIIDELIGLGDIDGLCGSTTEESLCIVTDGSVPTLAEAREFIADTDPKWFEKGDDLWWLNEITEEYAKSSYDPDELSNCPVFTEAHQFTGNRFALFVDSESAHVVTAASNLDRTAAMWWYNITFAPGCRKFVMREREYHAAGENDQFHLLRMKRNSIKRFVTTGTLRELLCMLRFFPVDENWEWTLIMKDVSGEADDLRRDSQ